MAVANVDELKYLGFVKQAALSWFFVASYLYDFAKSNSGPLKPAVGSVERAVEKVVGPLYDKFKDVPQSVIVSVDQKIDDAAPSTVKKLVNKGNELIQTAVAKVGKVVNEVKCHGPRAGLEYAAKESKDILVSQSVNGWVMLEQNSTFNKLGENVLSFLNISAVEYNHLVGAALPDKGLTVFKYLPLVPVEEIKDAYKAKKSGDAQTPATGNEQTTNADTTNADEAAKEETSSDK